MINVKFSKYFYKSFSQKIVFKKELFDLLKTFFLRASEKKKETERFHRKAPSISLAGNIFHVCAKEFLFFFPSNTSKTRERNRKRFCIGKIHAKGNLYFPFILILCRYTVINKYYTISLRVFDRRASFLWNNHFSIHFISRRSAAILKAIYEAINSNMCSE